MAQSAFAVHLGGGLYLDSDGTLTQGAPPPGAPVYEAPFKLPVDPKKAKDAMEGVQKALKDVNKDPAILKKFADFGFDTKILDVLSGIAKVAGVVAPVLAAVAIIYDLLKIFGVFKDGPNPLEELVKQRFDELETNVESIKMLIQTKDLRDHRVEIETFVADIRSHIQTMQWATPTDAQLEADRTRLLALEDLKERSVALMLDEATWIANFDRDEHTRAWPLLQGLLHTFPGSGSTPAPVPFPADGSLQFDHRLMVPLATWAAESYIACIRGILPEHRSTGEFRDNLRLLANKMDDLAKGMRTHGLARTVYRKEHFAFPVLLQPYEVTTSLFQQTATIGPSCSRFPVGAMDLRYHGDPFFKAFLDGLARAEFFGYAHPSKCGGMDFRWMPPAQLAPGPYGQWQITNPEECAAAANEQAERDYADLLSVSGYSELLRIAALLRSESTEPDRSQTVLVSAPALYRDPQARSAVTVESAPIFMTGIITSPAQREPQRITARVTAGTQPIKRARPAEYNIRLRTLRSFSGTRWHEPAYSDYHRPHYESDLTDSRFLRMAVFQNDMALDSHLLMSGSSPRGEARHAEGTVTLQAHTFDWWIPVKPPFYIDKDFAKTMVERRASGWSPVSGVGDALARPPVMHLHSGDTLVPAASWVQTYRDLIPELAWKSGDQDWDGQHRDPRQAEVTLDYKLTWDGDRLTLWLDNHAADRNFVVHLVLEEKLLGSGQVLHSHIAVPINGQLTFVPQKFFDDEAEAIARAAKTVKDFNDKYSETRIPGPFDPVVGWLRPADLVSPESLSRFETLARQHAPALLGEVMSQAMQVVRR